MWSTLKSQILRRRFYCMPLGDIENRKTPAFHDSDNIVGTLAFCDVANRVANRKMHRKSLFIVGTPHRATNRVANRKSRHCRLTLSLPLYMLTMRACSWLMIRLPNIWVSTTVVYTHFPNIMRIAFIYNLKYSLKLNETFRHFRRTCWNYHAYCMVT